MVHLLSLGLLAENAIMTSIPHDAGRMTGDRRILRNKLNREACSKTDTCHGKSISSEILTTPSYLSLLKKLLAVDVNGGGSGNLYRRAVTLVIFLFLLENNFRQTHRMYHQGSK
jgi:hypothetical protein